MSQLNELVEKYGISSPKDVLGISCINNKFQGVILHETFPFTSSLDTNAK